MLIGLTLRGVAFDFRVKARAERKALWNGLFALGSLLAAMAQGWMLGAWLTGFDNGLWPLLFTAGIALTLPTAYAMLGAGWLIMKTWDALQLKAVGWARAVILPMGVALVGISLATPMISPTVFDKWFSMPEFIGLLPIPVACAAAFYAAFHVISKPKVVAAGYGWVVFASTVLLFVLAFFGLAYSIYPYIVIDKLTVWQAASAHESLVVIFVGTAITLPVIVVYTNGADALAAAPDVLPGLGANALAAAPDVLPGGLAAVAAEIHLASGRFGQVVRVHAGGAMLTAQVVAVHAGEQVGRRCRRCCRPRWPACRRRWRGPRAWR
jgi:hypothetical protein